jgi:hypothetical protein
MKRKITLYIILMIVSVTPIVMVKGTDLTVRVIDIYNQPIKQVHITVAAPGTSGSSIQSDINGKSVFTGLQTIKYKIGTNSPSYHAYSDLIGITEGSNNLDIVLRKQSSLAVFIYEENGDPAYPIFVILYGQNTDYYEAFITDLDGLVTFGRIPEDDYDVILEKDGKELKTTRLTVIRDQTNQSEITLPASSSIPSFPFIAIIIGIMSALTFIKIGRTVF